MSAPGWMGPWSVRAWCRFLLRGMLEFGLVALVVVTIVRLAVHLCG